MDENPYQAPGAPDPTGSNTKAAGWQPFGWALIGFVGGMLFMAPFVLSLDLSARLLGGAMFGGPVGALLGLAHGLRRRREARD